MNNWCICWFFMYPLNAELYPICHLLATIFVVSRLTVKCPLKKTQPSCPGSRDLNWTGKVLRQRFPYFLRRGALFRTEIRRGALSSHLNQRHICAYLAALRSIILAAYTASQHAAGAK